ncbi:MAG: MmgE/PrpD family protein, partial [Burkholderiaceae bacterium]|nr:MmgE/PrpD family protein [Burkholderiaceae bacterium]
MKPSRQEHAAADAATSTGEGIGVALARFAASANPDRFPESARQVLEMSLLDWFAVAVAGRNEPVSRIVRDLVLAEEGRRECGVI